MLPLLLACGGEPAPVLLTDADNHIVTRTLDIPVVSVEPLTDWTIRFSEVGSDLTCQKSLAADPWLTLLKLDLTAAEAEVALATSNIKQADILGFVEHDLSGTCEDIPVTELSFFGTPLSVEELEEGYSYLLAYTDGAGIQEGSRYLSLALLEPEVGGLTTAVLQDGCGMLDVSATFAEPVAIGGASSLNWSGLTVDALGSALSLPGIDTLQLGYFSGSSAADLEADYLSLSTRVTQRWEIDVTDRKHITAEELAELDRFDVSDGNGTWLLGLWGGDIGLLPRFLTIIEE